MVRKIVSDATIIEASDGYEALELSDLHHPDITFMDVQMPRMDGHDATKAIRRHQSASGRRSTILALTAGALASERETCLEAGMDGFLTKPVDRQKLEEVLMEAFKNRHIV